MPAALQANAVGAVAILENLSSPDDVILDTGIAGLFIFEDDPLQYMNNAIVQEALAEKEFLAVCDILPTAVMDLAHLVLPSASFAEKQGSVISGNGQVRNVARACRGPVADLLPRLLHHLSGEPAGSPYGSPGELLPAGLLADNGGGGKTLAAATGKARFLIKAAPAALSGLAAKARPYQLIVRDLFINHHLVDQEVYGRGIAQIQRDMLYISPEDAADLAIRAGEELCLESDNGSLTGPVTIKTGLRKGILECLPFRNRREVLALSPRPAKVIAVSIKKL